MYNYLLIVHGRIIIAQSKANYLSCIAPVVPPLILAIIYTAFDVILVRQLGSI